MNYTINILKEELIYDITAFIHKAMDVIDPFQQKTYQIRPEENEFDQSIIKRILDGRDSIVRVALQKYLLKSNSVEASDILDNSATSYVYIVNMPDNWPNILLNPLMQNIHDFLVNATLFIYYSKNMPSMSGTIEYENYLDEIKHIICQRTNYVTRPVRPF